MSQLRQLKGPSPSEGDETDDRIDVRTGDYRMVSTRDLDILGYLGVLSSLLVALTSIVASVGHYEIAASLALLVALSAGVRWKMLKELKDETKPRGDVTLTMDRE